MRRKIRIWPDWKIRPGESQAEWFQRVLLQDLQILASDADIQIRAFPPMIPAADEMVSDLDLHLRSSQVSVDEGLITHEMLEKARKVLARISEMSDKHDPSLWTDQGLRTRAEWDEVRRLAKEALSAMGYDLEPPPSWKGFVFPRK